MSAHEQMRRMLDELMGTSRNDEDSCKRKMHFYSSQVCKSFLLNCCPHEILAATRHDQGECPKVHNVALRADFENAENKDAYNFEEEALKQLRSFIAESERRIHIAKIRLAETQETLNAKEAVRLGKIHQITEKIDETVAKAEQLGANGNLEESLKMLDVAENLKEEKQKAEEEYRNATPSSIIQQQKLRVCEVCSSYLGMNDTDKRLADHFNGKLHLGFIYIREKLKEIEGVIQERHIKRVLDNEFHESNLPKRERSRSNSPDSHHHHHHCKKRRCHNSSHRHRSKHKHKSCHHRRRHSSHSSR